ncbi:MAG: lamin tail domain-containing protein [Candidatus Peribacteraceae bacterium]|nr:lamin tail domain-containing protein [Candidatus Peribacteraceae bacterium]
MVLTPFFTWLSGLLVAFASVPATGSGTAVISEVLWMGSDLSAADEWVEIVSVGGETALDGWTLTSLNASGEEAVLFTFAAEDVLQEGEYVIVANGGAADSRLLEEPRFVTSGMSLPNTKLLLRLRNASGALMDEVDDGIGVPFAGANPSGGIKAGMERIDLTGSGALKENWTTATDSCGFDSGAAVLGTPGFAFGSCATATSSESASSETMTSSSSISSCPAPTEGCGWSSSSSSSLSSASPSSASSVSSDSSDSSISSEPFTMSSSSEQNSSSSSVHFSSHSSADSLSSSSPSSVSSDSSVSSVSSVPVRLTEVLPDAPGSDTAAWVEIANLGAEAVDIIGWTVACGSKSFAIPGREDGAFLLAAGEHKAFRNAVSGLSFLHAGGTVYLKQAGAIMDSLTYPGMEEGVSYGRTADDPAATRMFCAPTEGSPNTEASWGPSLVVQSGTTRGEGSVTINVQATEPGGFAGGMRCSIDFGDGFISQSCNPAAYTYEEEGTFSLRASMTNYCGNTVIQSITIDVLPKPSSSTASSENQTIAVQSGGGGTNEQQMYASSVSKASSASSAACTPTTFSDIVIQAFLPDPTGDDAAGEWIELRNLAGTETSLCGWSLGVASKAVRFSLDGQSVGAEGTLLLPYALTKVSLRNSEDVVQLMGPVQGSGDKRLIQQVPYERVKTDAVYVRGEDGAYAWMQGDEEMQEKVQERLEEEETNFVQKISVTSGLKVKSSSSKTSAKKTTVKTTATKKKSSSSAGMDAALIASLLAEGDAQVPARPSLPLLATLGSVAGVGGGAVWIWKKKKKIG